MLRHRDDLIIRRRHVCGTPDRNEDEDRRGRRQRGNREAPSSIPRDLARRLCMARAFVGARDVRQQHLASRTIGKMRLEPLALARRQGPVAVRRQRFRVGTFGRRRTGLRAHRTAQDRVERLVYFCRPASPRHRSSILERAAAGKLHCARRFIRYPGARATDRAANRPPRNHNTAESGHGSACRPRAACARSRA